MDKTRKPKWWLLNLLVIGIGLVLFLAHQWALSPVMRQLLLLVLIVLGYGLIAAWVHSNAGALEAEARAGKQSERPKRDASAASDPHLNARQQHFRRVMSLQQDRSI